MHYLAALEKLKKGSKLYLECQSNPSIFHQDLREELKNKGQKPYATIITCSDSRVPVQHIFSSSMGELFIIRFSRICIRTFRCRINSRIRTYSLWSCSFNTA